MLQNKLYLVCPFSQMEGFITREIYSDAYFITGMAARLCLDDDYNTEVIRYFIEKEEICELVIVNDTGCRIIHEVLTNSIKSPSPASDALKKLVSDFREVFSPGNPVEKKKQLLAKLNVNDHCRELKDNKILKTLFLKEKVKISGLLTNKAGHYYEPLMF